MSTFKRSDRIAGQMLRKLSTLIQQEVKDPRLPSFLTISSVKVSSDLSLAKVYFTVYGADVQETADILNTAASYLRTALARTMTIRTVPALHFIYDESIEYGRKLTKLIDEATSRDAAHKDPDSDNEDEQG